MKRNCTTRLARRLKDARGSNIVEMALVLPLLFLLTFSIVDFASLFYVYLALENGVSQAGRFGVTGNVAGELSREDSIRDAMRNATPTLTIDDNAFSFSHLKTGHGQLAAGFGRAERRQQGAGHLQLGAHDAVHSRVLSQRRRSISPWSPRC